MRGFGAPNAAAARAEQLTLARKHASQGQISEALQVLESLTSPDTLATQVGLATVQDIAAILISQQRWDQAIRLYGSLERFQLKKGGSNKAARIHTLFNQAAKASEAGNHQLSLELHCRLFSLEPDHTAGLRHFAVILRRLSAYNDAETYVLRYLSQKPDCPAGLNTYATILDDLGRQEEAFAALHRSLELDPTSAHAASNLAVQYHLKALIDPAYVYSSKAVALAPERYSIWLDYLTHLRRVCDFQRLEAINWWALIQAAPVESMLQAFLQMLVLAETDQQQLLLRQALTRWGDAAGKQAASAGATAPQPASPRSRETLRIGFVSADFRDHSVARFIWPLFEHLDRSRYQLFGYSTYTQHDAWRARFDEAATGMRDVASASPLELKRLVQADGIDILFDLTGFTKGSRTKAFATRLAPIQVSWLGYPGSTGLAAMDYLFLDRYLTPKDPSVLREKPLISPGTTVCFSGIPEVPITPIIPEQKRGVLTLGTLNNSYKITRSTITRWCRVLSALPTAQFLFVRREFESHYLRQNLIIAFAEEGIDASRLHFFNNRRAGRHYLDCYNELDFTLDTYPVTGGTTTTDALWMGVPVVGLEGPNVHHRVCSAILHHAGHPEWIAQNDDQFLQIALDLAADQNLRIKLRQCLRAEIKASRLCNSQQFAADFAATIDTLRPAA